MFPSTGQPCSCEALAFHHLDPTTKRFNVAGSYNRGLRMLKAEAAKCVLLCENCHREVERGLAQIPAAVRARVEAHIATVERYPPRRPGRPAIDDW